MRGPVELKQFTSWAFSDRLRAAGIAPSMGAVGAAADNAMMESFWGRMQVELLNRRRWKTRIELATGIHDYLQFHNTRRRHSALGMRTPAELEDGWLRSQDERFTAKTTPDLVVDETSAPGLFDTQVEDHHQQHLQLLENNDQAA